jgi:serine/threonine protein phosphatase PrpC
VTAVPEVNPVASVCPTCGEPVTAGDRFCEACGSDVPLAGGPTLPVSTDSNVGPPGATGCVACGGSVAADGYCEQCGLKQPDPHDHEEIDLGWAAGVTDRGLRHPDNEDAMGLVVARPGLAVAIVCDGVSSSSNAAAAAMAAVRAAEPLLLEEAGRDAKAALVASAAAAQRAVVAVPKIGDGEAPSCTFVAGVLHDGDLTVGWVGDSRAYWLGADSNRRLSTDDSWAAEQVAAGCLTESEAEASEEAHGITRWLGADAPAVEPGTIHFHPPGPGRVLLCSDGLWNYASTADELAALLVELPAPATSLDVARHLVDFARNSGGHDNITVVILAVTADKGER